MQGIFRFTLTEKEHQHEIKTPLQVCNPMSDKSIQCDAIWDTGATNSMIAENVARKLLLRPTGKTTVAGVHGISSANCYTVMIKFGNGTELKDVKVSEASNVGGFGLLVGMDIIGKGRLCVDGMSDTLSVTFELPV
jgi:hypothetical protein